MYAHCKCKNVHFWIARPTDGAGYKAKVCDGVECAKGTGMNGRVVAWASVPGSRIYLNESAKWSSEDGLGTSKTYASWEAMGYGFCGVCGASVLRWKESVEQSEE